MTVGLARGDRRGGHLRLLGSIPYPISLGGRRNPAPSIAGPFGAFGPAGFAAAGVYQTIDGSRDYARVAILPLP